MTERTPPIAEALASRALAPLRTRRPAPPADGGVMDHGEWAALLDRVTDGWRVDYDAAARDPALPAYLARIATADAGALRPGEALAFWINAYNACVLALVADRRPPTSVLDLPGGFTRVGFRVSGRVLTADGIEHGIVRRLGDARAHYGLNCASRGCPPLRAYSGDDVGPQLAANGRRYLADEGRGARGDGDRILLSRIFQWFGGDFAPVGSMPSALGTLLTAARPRRVLPAVRPLLRPGLRAAERVGFLPYDWSLNAA